MHEKRYTQEAIDSQVSPSSEVLNLVADAVPVEIINSPEIQDIIDRMLRVGRGRQGDAKYPTLVGLAAPQIGISKRIVIIGVDADGSGKAPILKEFINPEIIEQSGEKEDGREGCFSTDRVCGIVERASRVTVKAFDRNGQEIIESLDGFPARVAQHEIDHLDGVRFPDRITDDSKLHWVKEEEFGDYRKHWRTWPIECPRSKWEAIKLGKTIGA